MRRCNICKLSVQDRSPVSSTCRQCQDSLNRYATGSTADLKARQARRRELQKQLLPDLLRKHAANRAEVAKKILTFVGFDLPE